MITTKRRFLTALFCTALSAPLAAQAQWKQLAPKTSPSKRGSHHMTADLISVFVFAGNASATAYFNDLWRFDGTNWTELSKDGATGSPARRRWGAMTFDFARNHVVVFGGQDSTGKHLGDTWTWDGTKWTQHSVATAPGARRWATMAYDWGTSRVILFGGYDGSKPLADTWAWNGKAWTKLTPKNSPTARGRHAMAPKQSAKEIILYGGTPGTASPALSDMWKWDGSDWSRVTTKNAPYTTGVLTHPMYWDTLRERLVVFGGYNSGEKDGTWEFHGDTWTERKFTTKPVRRSRPGMAYITVFDKAIMFGGYGGPVTRQLNDTWEYQTNAAATVQTAGTGCAGSGGVPTISNVGLPWIDDTFELKIGGIGTGNSMLVIGLSKTTWTGGSLPFNLGVIGYPSCNLLVSMDLVFGGLTGVKVPIPNTTALIGQQVFFQAASLGPGNVLGVSRRTEIKVGAR